MTPEETIEAADLMRMYAESVKAGRPIAIEYRGDAKPGGWIEAPTPMWAWHAFEYRERPAPPKPKYRAYATVAEVPVGAVVRSTWGYTRAVITGARPGLAQGSVYLVVNGDAVSTRDAVYGWLIDATGEPAGVRVEPKQEGEQ